MNKINIPFAGNSLTLDLPPQWEVIAELEPRPADRLNDIPAALLYNLDHPIGSPPLSFPGLADKKIAIVIDDDTRPTPTHLFFRAILDYLASHGARRKDITLCIALGVHKPMKKEEVAGKVGDSGIFGLRWINHDCRDRAQHIDIGTTTRGTKVLLNRNLAEADVIICIGLIEPHPLIGFSGGLKMLLPGMAHKETIAQNHMQGLISTDNFNYVGVCDSPARQDLEEGVRMLNKRIFIVNVILNRDLEISYFVCGDPVAAHREGVKMAESIAKRDINEQADVAITASRPMDADLRQGAKCIANVEPSVKKGGLILAFLECRNGVGDIYAPIRRFPISYELLRLALRAASDRHISGLLNILKDNFEPEERFLASFSLKIARKNAVYVFSPNLPPGTDKKLGVFRQFKDCVSMLKAAERSAPKRAKVYVFPYGGATYPTYSSLRGG